MPVAKFLGRADISSEQEMKAHPTGGSERHPSSMANLSRVGHTNNPGGRPKKTLLTDALRMLCDPDSGLNMADLEERNADSIPVAVAKALLREAVQGKPAAFSEVADRVEGKVTQKTEHGGGAEPIPLSLEVHDRLRLIIQRLRDRQAKATGSG